MSKILGTLLMLAGVALGLYVGVWLCFVGGIVDLVEVVKYANYEALKIGWGVVKIMFAGAFGGLAAYLLIIPGWVLVVKN